MGRGRAKAKQAKVARDLKYRTHEPDLGALAAELHAKQHGDEDPEPAEDEHSEDPESEYADSPRSD